VSTGQIVQTASSPIEATVRPPGSKSQTIRALVVSGLAAGTSRLHHPLDAGDTRAARRSLRALGVVIDDNADPWAVTGTAGRLQTAGAPLDAGASGLTARALIAMAPLVDGPTTITGRDRLPERPFGGLLEAVRSMGAKVTDTGGRLPVTVMGFGALTGGEVRVAAGETSQYLTSVLMAAPLADEPSTITPIGLAGSGGYVEMTLELMRHFGGSVTKSGESYRVEPTGYSGTDVEIEPDASAAVYPMVAAAITKGQVTIEGLGSGSVQPDMEVARVLQQMGCEVTQTADSTVVSAPGRSLSAVDVDLSGCPDGSLAVVVACLFADGPSRLSGLGSLRFKESDRLAALVSEVRRLGAGAEAGDDTLTITPAPLRASAVDTHEDHRIAMAFALVGLVVPGVEVSDPRVVDKTWPGYWAFLRQLVGNKA
jgi:3-phosphoshikimate 1-carboxyvinyltransferase